MINRTLFRYVLVGAVRDRMILSYAAVVVLAACLSVFIGSAAVVEKGAFALISFSGGLRIASVMALVLFTVFFLRRSFEAKDVEYLLSRPLSRIEFVLSYCLSLVFIAAGIALIQWLSLSIFAFDIVSRPGLLWGLSVAVENIIMVLVAFFFAMVISSAAAACMVVFAFYVLTRMMGQILGIIAARPDNPVMQIPEMALQMVSSLMPRLDLMGQSAWLLYGDASSTGFGYILLQGFVFSGLVIVAAMLDLVRRQF